MLQTQHNRYDLKAKTQLLDDQGFLIDANDWTSEFTERHAAAASIELTEQHWQLITMIRDKYLRLGSLPLMRKACKESGVHKIEMIRQFGSCLTLWKIAGLPNPGEEAKAYLEAAEPGD